MSMLPILVFDLGTSALKVTLFAADGSVLNGTEWPLPVGDTAHRQAPADWWQAAVAATRGLQPPELGAIALTGTMENLIPVAADGTALGDALLYSDPAGIARHAAFDDTGFSAIAGNAAEPLMTAFKLDWLREHEPERFAAARWFLPGSKDYLSLRMTGRAATDATCAATTGLLDYRERRWSPELLARFGVGGERLPALLPATATVGPLLAEPARELGLAAGVPVVNGCGDGGATTVGSGALRPADISLYLGSSGWVARIVPTPETLDPRPIYRLPHPLADSTVEIAPVLSAGAATDWARTALGLDLAAAERLAQVADAAPGDVIFLPYLAGERFPFLDLDVRAGFLGLEADTGSGALYYAVLEGVALAVAANIDAMGGLNGGNVSLCGGGGLSDVWPRIVADLLGTPVVVPTHPKSATSLGAFRIACAALAYPDVAGPGGETLVEPRPERRQRGERLRRRHAVATEFARRLARD